MWVRSLSWEDAPGEGYGKPLQCSCLENLMDRGAWRTTIHRVTKSQPRLKGLSMHVHTGAPKKLIFTKSIIMVIQNIPLYYNLL